jgi:hypothetical protein
VVHTQAHAQSNMSFKKRKDGRKYFLKKNKKGRMGRLRV